MIRRRWAPSDGIRDSFDRRVADEPRRVIVDRRIADMTPGRRAQVRRATDSIGRGTAPAPRVPLNNLPGDGRERKS